MKLKIEMKAKMGHSKSFPARGTKSNEAMGGIGLLDLADLQTQRRTNWLLLEHRNGSELGVIGVEILKKIERQIGT